MPKFRRTERRDASPVRTILLTCAALLAFGAALIVTMPARSLARFVELPPQVVALDGRVVNGAAIMTEGYRISWTLSPTQLVALSIGAEARMTGPDTRLDATVQIMPDLGMRLFDLKGRAGSGLLDLMPGLGLDCDGRALVDVAQVIVRRTRLAADGRADIEGAVCRGGPEPIVLPPTALVLTTEGDSIVGTWRADGGDILARASVSPERRFDLRIEPAGARLIPGMPSSAATQLSFPF